MIIAVANQKGGVAKTTSVICLGGLLASHHPCLVIDLDPQGNLTTGLGMEVGDEQLSCYDVITEQALVADAIVATKSGLNLLPADITLAKGETEILTKVGNFYILKERLEPVQSQFDCILIDCPPSLGLLTVKALNRDTWDFRQDGLKTSILQAFEDLLQSSQKRLDLQREIKPFQVMLQVFGHISAQCPLDT